MQGRVSWHTPQLPSFHPKSCFRRHKPRRKRVVAHTHLPHSLGSGGMGAPVFCGEVLDNSLDLIQQQPAPGAGAAWSPYRKLTSMHAGMMQQSALSTLTVSGRALCKQCTPKRRWIVQT
mmetsp:Transcript_5476/g.14804  ORF Transcript_5476/g.14804 Transcript_5476/m.14804 type:complete len:119 (+) Transcript_5476:102-458(+)